MLNIRKFLTGIRILGKSVLASDSQGELEVNSSDGKINYHNGTSRSPVVTEAHTATLTNKSIDSDTNTLSNIKNSDIKSGAAIDAAKIAAGTVSNTEFGYIDGVTSAIQTQIDAKASTSALSVHTGASSGVHGVTGSVVGTTDTQTLTNKTVVVASNTITTAASGNLTSTELNAALSELQTDIDTRATSAALTAHTGATSAHGVSGNIVGTTDTQTLTNKTLTAPTIDVITLDGQASTPSTPASGFYKTYVKDSTNKLTLLDSAGVETTIGSGSGGGALNFILNPDAEAGTTGWATYADAAGTRPVDGTGGSPNVTFTASSTSPLAGANSFIFTKDAANRQGQGASYDFVINNESKAKVLQISLSYLVNSGTFVAGTNSTDSDVIVYLYDVTNSALIEPSSIKLLSNNSSLADKFNATFQTSATGSTYRLIFHCASTSASAYSLKIDTVSVSPSTYVFGTPVTDWQLYTPTTVGFGTISFNESKWRRVGDSAELSIKFVAGTNTSVEARVGLPPGLTSADTSKIPTISFVGEAVRNDGTAPTSPYRTLIEPSKTYLTFGQEHVTVFSKIQGTNFPSNFYIGIYALVPIQGFSSSVQTSDQTDTRIVAAAYTRGSALSVSNNTTTILPFSTSVYDTHNAYNSTTGIYTVPVSGKYKIHVFTEFAGNSTGHREVFARKNSANSKQLAYFGGQSASFPTMLNGSVTIDCINGDTIDIVVYQDSGGSLNAAPDGDQFNHLEIERISGPSAIASSELVVSRGSNNAGSSISDNTWSDIPTATLEDNSHNSLTTAGVFTAPTSGRYLIAATVCFAANASGSRGVRIRKNGSGTGIGSTVSTSGVVCSPAVSGCLNLLAGDTIAFQGFQNSGGALALNTGTDLLSGISIVKQ